MDDAHTICQKGGIISAPPEFLTLRIFFKHMCPKLGPKCCAPNDFRSAKDLVRKLSKRPGRTPFLFLWQWVSRAARPVVGKFRRPAVSDSAGATTKLWSSVNSMGAQLLTAARGGEQWEQSRTLDVTVIHILKNSV